MPALAYRNTKTTLPNWNPIHEKQARGIAYETDTHFVHIYGTDSGLWPVSIGLTATERKSGTLRDWVQRVFGAVDIEETIVDVGETIRGVWRPGLFYDGEILQGLTATPVELRLAEQALLLLVQRLDELLLFVEPSAQTLNTYSHKSRELLILSCTEVENCFKAYLDLADISPPRSGQFSTTDYVKLRSPLCLDEFEVRLPRYSAVPATRPFHGWHGTPSPTKTLPWYAAYNKTKHNRGAHFGEATLWNCIQAVAANIVMFSARLGPFRLYHGAGTLAALFNQHFSIELRDCRPASFYAPRVHLPPNQRNDLICFNAAELVQPRKVIPLQL